MNRLFILLFFYSMTALSGQWPVITNIKSVKVSQNIWDYYITQELVEIGPSVDVVVPDKYIELTHRHNPATMDYVGTVETSSKTSLTDTISKTAVALYNTRGANIDTIRHSGDDPTNLECVAYVVAPTNQQSIPWSSVVAPGGCMVVPPAGDWCKLTTPEIVLEHGTMTLQEAEGSTATGTLNVQCTVATAVSFNLISNESYIYLDEGKSEITVGNQPLKTKIDLPQGDSQTPIKDLLTGVTSEGYHTGSSVLVMMPY